MPDCHEHLAAILVNHHRAGRDVARNASRMRRNAPGRTIASSMDFGYVRLNEGRHKSNERKFAGLAVSASCPILGRYNSQFGTTGAEVLPRCTKSANPRLGIA